MRWNIIVECVEEDGQRSTITVGTIERLAASTTAENLGVNLRESKQIANRLQDTVVKQQLQEYCERRRKCLTCGRQRPVKDFRCRRLETVLGTVRLRVPRYRPCQCCSNTQVWSPIPEVLSGRVTPELRTPLTAIRGLAETLEVTELPQNERTEVASAIRHQAEDLQQLVTTLMPDG